LTGRRRRCLSAPERSSTARRSPGDGATPPACAAPRGTSPAVPPGSRSPSPSPASTTGSTSSPGKGFRSSHLESGRRCAAARGSGCAESVRILTASRGGSGSTGTSSFRAKLAGRRWNPGAYQCPHYSQSEKRTAVTDIVAELRSRGLIAQSTVAEALSAAMADGPVTYYCGFDPTAPSLHHALL